MRFRYLLWSSALIASLVVSGLCMRGLALEGVPYHASLVIRGLFCLAMAIVFGLGKGLSLVPKAPGTQVVRALLAGLALSLYTLSYNWLSASSISVLSNIDVPLLVVLGPMIGVQATPRNRVLALLSISFLVFYVIQLEFQPRLLMGLGSLGLGTLLLCFGYLFIKKSMKEENEAITILVPALAIIFYGIVQGVAFEEANQAAWTPRLLFAAALSGTCMFLAYFATMRLYDLTNLATAEFPTLIASIVIQPFEAFFLNAPLHAPYLLSSIGFVIATYFILASQNRAQTSEVSRA